MSFFALQFSIFVISGLVTYFALNSILNNRRKIRGYRTTGTRHYRGAADGTSALPVALSTSPVGAPLPAGVAQGDASDPRAGEGPRLDPDAKAPDQIEVITGWRAWGYNSGYLTSVNDKLVWCAGEALVAECTAGHRGMGLYAAAYGPGAYTDEHAGETIPVEHCTCGIYASRAPGAVQWPAGGVGQVYIWGQIAMWGKVVQGGKGWRSQYAYPERILVWAGSKKQAEKLAEKLAKRYGVPASAATVAEAKAAGCYSEPARMTPSGMGSTQAWAIQQRQIALHKAANTYISTSANSNWQYPSTPSPLPAQHPFPNSNFKAFGSTAEYQAFVKQQYDEQMAKLATQEADEKEAAKQKSIKAAQYLIDRGLVLPASAASDLEIELDERLELGEP